MIDPADLKTDDTREPDSLPTFIIFCEDEVSEPNYFKYFETDKIVVNPIPGQKNGFRHIQNAIDYCDKNQLINYQNDANAVVESPHVWCVFDRDKEDDNEIETEARKKGNIDFNGAINYAESKGLNVAWSNDCFELWILLHYEGVDPQLEVNKYRKAYYDRLTFILKNRENPSEELSRAIAHSTFNYKQDLKKRSKFINIVRNHIVRNTSTAIERAKKLENFYNTNKPNHQKAPCTLVHHLVTSLLELGGKEVIS